MSSPSPRAVAWRWWGPAALAAGVLLVRLPSLTEPGWASDDGFFTAIAVLMSKGVPLYAGVYDSSPPGVYWTYRLLVGLGAVQHHWLVQGLAALLAVASALLTFGVASRVTERRTALLAGWLAGVVLSIPTLDGDLLNVELLALPFFLGGLLLSFARRPAPLVAAGLLLAAAYADRPSYLLDMLALAVPLLSGEGRLRRAALVAGGMAAGLAAVAVGLAAEGSLVAYLSVVVPADHSYVLWSNDGTAWPLLTRLAALAAAGALCAWRSRTPAGRLAAVWVFASIAGSSITPRELSHYSHEAIPSLAFAASLLAARLPLRALTYPLAAAGVAVTAGLVLFLPGAQTALETHQPAKALQPNFGISDLPAYYANWFDYVSGREGWPRYRSFFPGSATTDAAEAQRLRAAAGGRPFRLLVLGDRPWLYVDTGALNATPFIATNSAFWQVGAAVRQTDAALAGGCAGIVVYQSGPGDWGDALRQGGYRPAGGMPWPTYLTSRHCG